MEVVDNLLISLSTLMVLPCAAARPALLRKPSAKHADLRAAQAKAAADRDVAALVQSVEGTIWKIADHYSRGLSKEDVEDLRAAGRVGAVVAAERYDVSRGASFNTYALSWIRAYVVKEVFFFWGKGRLRGTNGAVRRIFFRQGRARRDLAAAGTKETPEALADAMGVNVSILADVEVAIAANVPQEYLKDVSSDDGGVLARMCVADESDPDCVAILRRVPQLRWAAVVEVPRAEAFADLARLRNVTILMLIVLLVGVGLGVISSVIAIRRYLKI